MNYFILYINCSLRLILKRFIIELKNLEKNTSKQSCVILEMIIGET